MELSECLNHLVGDAKVSTALPEIINADDFAENILGFEEVEEIMDGDGGEQGDSQEMMMMMNGGGAGMG